MSKKNRKKYTKQNIRKRKKDRTTKKIQIICDKVI